ncbi:2OG-Fe(II) oxygenase [Brumimicrobium salinarum]|nr:2OG-Fe(II) oxygenase [Brumimicrobium salinarum]
MKRNLKFWDEQMDLLAQQDYVIIDQFLNPEQLKNIHSFFEQKQYEGAFDKAAIGQSGSEKVIKEIRGDYTYWLNRDVDTQITPLFSVFEEVKNIINQLMYLSLADYEFHLAHYPKGSYYKKHLDQFDGRRNRMVSMIIYLNKDWQKGDGGELRVYPENNVPIDVEPLENRCVLFRSDVLFHEVLQANTSRKSITGWMLYQSTELPHLM